MPLGNLLRHSLPWHTEWRLSSWQVFRARVYCRTTHINHFASYAVQRKALHTVPAEETHHGFPHCRERQAVWSVSLVSLGTKLIRKWVQVSPLRNRSKGVFLWKLSWVYPDLYSVTGKYGAHRMPGVGSESQGSTNSGLRSRRTWEGQAVDKTHQKLEALLWLQEKPETGHSHTYPSFTWIHKRKPMGEVQQAWGFL